MIVPVFKTGGRQAILSPVGSTPTRFRQFLDNLGARTFVVQFAVELQICDFRTGHGHFVRCDVAVDVHRGTEDHAALELLLHGKGNCHSVQL